MFESNRIVQRLSAAGQYQRIRYYWSYKLLDIHLEPWDYEQLHAIR